MNQLRRLSILVVFALASLARANVRVVAPSGAPFTQISSAIAAASDGDVVLVRSGVYTEFTITNKELAIVADAGADVRITQQVRILNLAATRSVLFSGLSIRPTADVMVDALTLELDQGAVRLVGCELRGPLMTQSLPSPIIARALYVFSCQDVALSSCTLLGGLSTRHEGVPGLFADASSVFVGQSSVLGSRGADGGPTGYGYGGGEGVLERSAHVITSASVLVGGPGGNQALMCTGGAGVGAVNSSELFSHDTRIAPGRSGSPCANTPTPAVILQSGSTALETFETARELRTALVAREQSSVELRFFGEPGDQVELILADATRFVNRPDLRGVSLVRRRVTGTVVPAGTIAGDGTLSFVLPIGDLGAGIESQVVHAQARFINAQGSSFLSSPASIVLLDAAF